jgi:hypothetical protein
MPQKKAPGSGRFFNFIGQFRVSIKFHAAKPSFSYLDQYLSACLYLEVHIIYLATVKRNGILFDHPPGFTCSFHQSSLGQEFRQPDLSVIDLT